MLKHVFPAKAVLLIFLLKLIHQREKKGEKNKDVIDDCRDEPKKNLLLFTKSGRKYGSAWDIELYVDSDHAADVDTRRSRTGYVILVNNNVIDYGTAMQSKTATSTPVAEYVALASGLKQLLWISQIFEECEIKVNYPCQVHEDNEGCIAIANNPMAQKRTRHMEIRYHFIRDYVNDEKIKISHCPTTRMLADMLTKALPGPALTQQRARIMSDIKVSPDQS